MVLKKKVLDKAKVFLKTSKARLPCRVCELILSGELDGPVQTNQLLGLINDSYGKKFKITAVGPSIGPLLKAGIIGVCYLYNGKKKNQVWFPLWMDKATALSKLNMGLSPVLFFDGTNSWSDVEIRFKSIVDQLEGEIYILDPYYGRGSFFPLKLFGKTRKIKFLTGYLGKPEQENRPAFDVEFSRFNRDFKNIKFMKLRNPDEVHDRYIVSENALVIVGHGIKDLATKESFVILLPKSVVGGHISNLRKRFEQKWSKAVNLI